MRPWLITWRSGDGLSMTEQTAFENDRPPRKMERLVARPLTMVEIESWDPTQALSLHVRAYEIYDIDPWRRTVTYQEIVRGS